MILWSNDLKSMKSLSFHSLNAIKFSQDTQGDLRLPSNGFLQLAALPVTGYAQRTELHARQVGDSKLLTGKMIKMLEIYPSLLYQYIYILHIIYDMIYIYIYYISYITSKISDMYVHNYRRVIAFSKNKMLQVPICDIGLQIV